MDPIQAVAALRDDVVCSALDPSGVVSFRGPDARRFCNGMFTNNVRDLAVGAVQRSALLDDRGRVLGLLRLACVAADEFLAFPDGGERAAFATRFASFIVFDDVEVEPIAFSAAFHVAGPAAAVAPGARAFASDRFGIFGWDVWGAPPSLAAVTDEVATWLRVRAGRVVWPDDVGDKRLVHELGLRDDALSFAKGCYIGQETVNRVDVMGGVKRRLTGIVAPGGGMAPGDPVVVNGEVAGAVTSVAGPLALAIVRIPADAPGTLVTVGERARPGETAAFPLPFPP